jgi:hypothetical protein
MVELTHGSKACVMMTIRNHEIHDSHGGQRFLQSIESVSVCGGCLFCFEDFFGSSDMCHKSCRKTVKKTKKVSLGVSGHLIGNLCIGYAQCTAYTAYRLYTTILTMALCPLIQRSTRQRHCGVPASRTVCNPANAVSAVSDASACCAAAAAVF